MSVSQATLAAARRRGVSLETIAQNLGVTRQAVHQRLQKWTDKTGETFKRYHPGVQGQVLRRCIQCGKTQWDLPHKVTMYFCSRKCQGLAKQKVSENSIEEAIRLRKHGYTWERIATINRVCYQEIQYRIWLYLFERNKLLEPVLKELFYSTSRHASYQHLINRTGLSPGYHNAAG
jgi:hypothetical protein